MDAERIKPMALLFAGFEPESLHDLLQTSQAKHQALDSEAETLKGKAEAKAKEAAEAKEVLAASQQATQAQERMQ